MTDLRIEDFDAFFRELHGPCRQCKQRGLAAHECEHVEPFAWQRDLVARIGSEGWPSTIELPTASGKTAVIDIAIFTLAIDNARSRRAPLRVFFVVDRRVVVDEAHRRALRIAAKLSGASKGPAYAVAQRLRALAGGETEPLVTVSLRGGIYREDGWARSPVQPLIAISTVDQVGSRLLARGYGVSDEMKPLHQGLVAHDSLIILDEAHLSEPFRTTLAALQDYGRQAEVRLPRPYQVVVMSATPRSVGPRHFKLEANHQDLKDRRPGRLLQRLEAHKWAELRPLVDVGKPPAKAAPRSEQRAWAEDRANRDSAFCKQAAQSARELVGQGHCVGVVVNRVGTARSIFEQLRSEDSFDAVLLTGRSRPLDREAVIKDIWPLALAGRERGGNNGRPLIIVATQCIEVGADLDFDGLVTECASIDALRQRFGRLDRLGELGESPAMIIARSDTLDNDPVYGQAIGETWKWLQKKAKKPRGRRGTTPSGESPRIDFGQTHFPNPTPAELEKMVAPPREAPVLLPAHLDAWAMTSPIPAVDPDIALWLHGVSDQVADVQIVWRSDLPPGRPELWADIVALCPPGSAEAMPLPVYIARAWLAQIAAPEIADTVVSIMDADMFEVETADRQKRTALRWCGEDDPRTDLVLAAEVRPGDTLVVPSEWGGADQYGWLSCVADTSRLVEDLGDRVQLEQRGRATLRICTPLCDGWVPATSANHSVLRHLVKQVGGEVKEDGDPPDVDGILARVSDAEEAAPWLREAARRLRADRRRRLDVHPSGGVVLRSARRSPYRVPAWSELEETRSIESDFTSQDSTSSFVCRPVGLRSHSLGVAGLATKFAEGCGLDADLVADFALSGRLHDVGKADPRFQRWLYGGDEVAAAISDLRAKSGMRSRSLRERARVIAGYPRGGRHELLSLAMIEPEVKALGAHDADLVLHLIASHHGLCRPFLPSVSDPDDVIAEIDGDIAGRPLRSSTATAARLARLDSGVSERYWCLLRKFGWLGLPYLEAVLRLADHRQSDAEEIQEQAQ